MNIPAKLLCGGFAGAVAQSFSYPLDVTRRRMQLAMMNPETAKFGYDFVLLLVFHSLSNIIGDHSRVPLDLKKIMRLD